MKEPTKEQRLDNAHDEPIPEDYYLKYPEESRQEEAKSVYADLMNSISEVDQLRTNCQMLKEALEHSDKELAELREQLKQREEQLQEFKNNWGIWKRLEARDNEIKELKEALRNLTPIVQHVVNGLMLNSHLSEFVPMNAMLDKAKKLIE